MLSQTKCEEAIYYYYYYYYASRLLVLEPKTNPFHKFTLITNFTSLVIVFYRLQLLYFLVAVRAVSGTSEILGNSQ